MIDISGLRFAYPNSRREVLSGLDWHADPGTVTLLTGDSGSGKSTLLRCFNGLIPHFHGGRFGGDVVVAGRSTREHAPRDLVPFVGTVFQDPESQIVTDTVVDEIVFTLEQLGISRNEIEQRLTRVVDRLEIGHILDREATTLSGGEQQLVVLAGALIVEPRVLLLDEPTSQLDDVNTDRLLGAVERLAAEGLTVVLAEHRLERVRQIATGVLALDHGELRVGGGEDLSGDLDVVDSLLRSGHKETEPGEVLLNARQLAVSYGDRRALIGVDLEVREGEVLAVSGANGTGKTTLLRTLAGIQRPSAGYLERNVKASKGPMFAGYVPQNPTSILHHETLQAELAFTLHAGGLRGDIEPTLAALGIERHLHRHPLDLSGGERQRAAIAAIVVGEPAVLLLDEPTRGLPAGEKQRLAAFVRSYAAAGRAVVVATHEKQFIRSCASREIQLHAGRLIGDRALAQDALVVAGSYAFDG